MLKPYLSVKMHSFITVFRASKAKKTLRTLPILFANSEILVDELFEIQFKRPTIFDIVFKLFIITYYFVRCYFGKGRVTSHSKYSKFYISKFLFELFIKLHDREACV